MSAQSDLGPTTPCKAAIHRRAQTVRDYANRAQERNHHGDTVKALYWLDQAAQAANWRREDDPE